MKRSALFIYLLFFAAPGLWAQCTTTITSFPYQENFEVNDGGWVTGGTASDWAWGTPQKTVITGAASGNKCWITGGLNKPAYNDGENSYLYTPCFNFTGLVHPRLSFSVFWETERRFDGANLQYSTNGGGSWTTLGVVGADPCTAGNWYNNTGITYLGDIGWSGNIQSNGGSCLSGSGSGSWLAATHDLTALAGQTVMFRFHFAAGTTCNSYDGFAIDLFTIEEAPTGPADFTYSCGPNTTINFTSISPTCPSGYAWNFDDVGSGANNTSALPNPSHQFTTPGPHTVTLVITYASAPQVTVTHTLEIITADLNVNSPIRCNGDNNGSITAMANGSSTGTYQYTWNTGSNNATISNLQAGQYTVTVTSGSSCPAVSSVTLTEPGKLQASPAVTDALCNASNGSIMVSVSGGTAPFRYAWSTGATGNNIGNLVPASYSVSITDNNNCTTALNGIVVNRQNRTIPVSLGNTTYVCPGDVLVLNPGSFATYLWQDNSNAPTYTVTTAGQYSVSVTDNNGCSGNATIKITADCGDIYFPKAFTPNGDAINPTFGAFGNIAAVTNYHFQVFNRYGELVFATTDPARRWDGTMKGEPYNTGTFVWRATYTLRDKPNLMQQGTVILLR